jgi:hypothetical protein
MHASDWEVRIKAIRFTAVLLFEPCVMFEGLDLGKFDWVARNGGTP